MKNKIEKMLIGNPTDKKTDVGPVVSKEQFNRIMYYINLGKGEGAEILTGGDRYGEKGYFIKPTVFINVKNEIRIAQEEISGPVLTVMQFNDDDEAVKIANESLFGLGGAVWSKNDERALEIAKKLRTGTL